MTPISIIAGCGMIVLAILRWARSFGQHTESFHRFIAANHEQQESRLKSQLYHIRLHEENREMLSENIKMKNELVRLYSIHHPERQESA